MCHTASRFQPPSRFYAFGVLHFRGSVLLATLRIFLTDADLEQADINQLALGELDWRLLDGRQSSRGRSRLADLPRAGDIELFLPASVILKTQTQLPPGGRRQARRLLPFALDNVLLTDSSKQHLALVSEGDHCRVAIIDKLLFAAILQAFTQAGLRLRAVWSIADLLDNEAASLLYRPGGWIASHAGSVLWIDANSPASCPAMVATWLSNLPSDASATLYLDEISASNLIDASWRAATPNLQIETADQLANPLNRQAISLLQGEFAAGPQVDVDWRKLQLSASLLAACLLLWFIAWLGSTQSMKSEEKALRASMGEAFKAAFPSEPLIDPKLQLQSHLRQNTGASGNKQEGISRLLDITSRLGSATDAPLVAINVQADAVMLDFTATPNQLAAVPALLGPSFNVTRSTPSSGTERFTIKSR